jgi:tRNA(Ile2) C34 agmatinyltransferase TiaS
VEGEHALQRARAVADFDAAETECPACGTRFATAGAERCPDCGLRFG